MYEPGWYHAQGDPAETVRYWDGQAWQGAATPTQPAAATPTQPGAGGIVYYDAGATTVDLGDIATQRTLAEQAGDERAQNSYAVSPYSVTKASPPVATRKNRGGLNFATMTLLSVLGPVLLFVLGVRGPLFYGSMGLIVVGMTLGRAKTMNSIWSGMRTTG